MHPLVLIVLIISSAVSYTEAVKCFECANNENNCNSGDCEGDWCVARYVTKNPFANDHDVQRVTKSCEPSHPTGYTNDSCVESISPSGRKLACGCRKDYCNDDKAVQKLPVESHDDGGPVLANASTPTPPISTGGDVVTHTNVQTPGSLKCYCDEATNCVNHVCQGEACTTEIFDETGLSSVGGGVRVGARISKGCAVQIPSGIRDNQERRQTTVTLPDGTSAQTEVTIFYCNNGNFCNNHAVRKVVSSIFLVLFASMLAFVIKW